MNKNLLFLVLMIVSMSATAQVTQINSNASLENPYPLTATKSIYASSTDSTLWVTDGTLAGTVQISTTIKFIGTLGSTAFMNGTMIFEGSTSATGGELYITNGTTAGTTLISDINPGAPSSHPDGDFAILNGFVYFTAERPAEGRELWRTDGTPGGTTLVKDIVPGPTGSNTQSDYQMFSSGSYLLFAVTNAASGNELWTSDGTNGGTALLKEINAGPSSSDPNSFSAFKNMVLFYATDAASGTEIWKTDGTPGGTTILKDINPGPGSSTLGFGTGFGFYVVFNDRAFFTADNGANGNEIWATDGTTGGTVLVKDVEPGPLGSFSLIVDAAILTNKFIFPVTDFLGSRYELWESDGTTAGTKLFRSFDGDEIPLIFIPFDISGGSFTPTQKLFQGNKFFFSAKTAAEGRELWISDGTLANTNLVKDINPGSADGLDSSGFSYTYTSSAFFFGATNETNGVEVWKSDGTLPGTNMVADIVTGAGTSEPTIDFLLVNSKVLFQADNGDDPVERDLYAVDGTFTPLPVKLADFTVRAASANAVVNWHTSQELNTKDFTVQRSFDGLKFDNIGTVQAVGNSTNSHAYTFTDPGVMNSGKSIVYYRLLTTDVNGKSSVSSIITLRISGSGKWNVKVLSAVSQDISVVLSDVTSPVKLSIVDLHGRKLISNSYGAVNGRINIPAGTLAHGNYILVAETAEERKAIQFVK